MFGSYAVCLLLIGICAKVSLSTVKKQCRFLGLYAICIFCIKIAGMPFSAGVFKNSALETLLFLQKFALILFTASLFYETTSRLELFILCERIERFFCKRKYTGVFSTIFAITLMCVPKVFELWALLNYAYDARTVRSKRSIASAYQRLAFLLPALIENLLRFALTAEKALKNRTASENASASSIR